MNNYYYTIDATILNRPSKKPRYVEERFRTIQNKSFESVELNRQMFYSKRIKRLNRKNKKVCEIRGLRNKNFLLKAERSAKKIQLWWRFIKIKKIFMKLEEANLFMNAISYEKLTKTITDKNIIKLVESALCMMKVDNSTKVCKTFLALFMIKHCKEDIFVTRTEEENVLINLSNKTLAIFELLGKFETCDLYTEKINLFRDLFHKSYMKFMIWKSIDKKQLTESMIEFYMELERLKSNIEIKKEELYTKYRKEIIKQQEQITKQIKKVDKNNVIIQKIQEKISSKRIKIENLSIVHNILINEDYKATLMKDSNNQLVEELFSNKENDLILKATNLIKEKLLSVLNITNNAYNKSIMESIEQKLNLDLIKEQISNRTFEVGAFFDFVISCCLLRMCAEARQSQIEEITHLKESKAKINKILEVIDQIRVDSINYYISLIKPFLKTGNYGIEYEKKTLLQLIEEGSLGLQSTKEWLNHIGVRDPLTTDQLSILITNEYVNFAFDSFNDFYPECITFDVEELSSVNMQIHKITDISAFLLSVNISTTRTPGELLDLINPQTKDEAFGFYKQISSIINPNETLKSEDLIKTKYKKCRQIIMEKLKQLVSTKTKQILTVIPDVTHRELLKIGLANFKEQILKIIQRIRILSDHNVKVYFEIYAQILHKH